MRDSGLRFLWITVLFLVLDQVTKQWVMASMELYQSIPIMPFFNLTYVHNPGAAFSFLADAGGWQRYFFTILAIVVSIVLVIWLAKTPKTDKRISVAFCLILGGAIGNVVDRMLFGYVIDFLDFYYQSYHWPAFNIADSAIFVGAGLLILDAFLTPSDKTNKSSEVS